MNYMFSRRSQLSTKHTDFLHQAPVGQTDSTMVVLHTETDLALHLPDWAFLAEIVAVILNTLCRNVLT